MTLRGGLAVTFRFNPCNPPPARDPIPADNADGGGQGRTVRRLDQALRRRFEVFGRRGAEPLVPFHAGSIVWRFIPNPLDRLRPIE
jgi:hypothetical protein